MKKILLMGAAVLMAAGGAASAATLDDVKARGALRDHVVAED